MAVKKIFTKKWLSQESPTLNAWMEITMDIYKMEQITASVNHKMEQFTLHWEKFIEYATSHRYIYIYIYIYIPLPLFSPQCVQNICNGCIYGHMQINTCKMNIDICVLRYECIQMYNA